MREKNAPLDLNKILKFWVLVTASVTPLIYLPIGGILNPYFPKLVFLIVIFIILIMTGILCWRQIFDSAVFDTENKLLAVYYLLLIASAFFAYDRATALFGSFYRFEGLLTLTVYFVIFLCARRTNSLSRSFILLILSSAVLIALHAIMQKYGLDPVPQHMYPDNLSRQAFSSMGNPNHLGTYMVLLIPFAAYWYIDKDMKSGFLIYCILFFALLCSNTRGSWIGFFAGFCAYGYLKLRTDRENASVKKKMVRLTAVSAFLILIYSMSFENGIIFRFLSIFVDLSKLLSGSEDSYMGGSNRIYIWMRVIELIGMHPLFGVGIDNLGDVFMMFFEYDTVAKFKLSDAAYFSKAHNEYLHIAVSSGIPSLLVYISFVFVIFKKSAGRISESGIYLPITVSIIGFYTVGFFNNTVLMFAYLLWIFLGFACSRKTIQYADKTG